VGDVLEQHITAFLGALRHEVARAIWRMVRAGIAAFAAVLVVGGIALTAAIYGLGQTPWQPLALLSYAMLGLAALSVAAAATALYLSLAVLRGIDRAAKRVLLEMRRAEGQVARVVQSSPFAAPPPDRG
jgi:hypothetical protein